MRRPSEKAPLGTLALALDKTDRTSSNPMPYLFRTAGSSSTRTPVKELPPTTTCPTPFTCESFCARMEEAASYTCPFVNTGGVRVSMKTGASAGLDLRYEGLDGRLVGKYPR